MPDRPPRRFRLADLMIPVASTACLPVLVRAYAGAAGRAVPGAIPAAIQATIRSAALLLGPGGLGACAARLRGRPRFEGFCWGMICGPFGLVMIAMMPDAPED